MPISPDPVWQPLQAALAEWAAAVAAVEADSLRIAKGGLIDRKATRALLMTVEVARLQCRFVSMQAGGGDTSH